jgi:hypothetical protein
MNRVGIQVDVYLKHGKTRPALRTTPTLKGDRLVEIGSLSNDGSPVLRHVIRLPRSRRYGALRREKMPQLDDPSVAQDVPLLVAKYRNAMTKPIKSIKSNHGDDTMGRITVDKVATAIKRTRAMTMAQKEALADEIFARQPNLLASVLVQKKLGVTEQKMEFLLNILLVCYQAMKETGLVWPLITEDDQERYLERQAAITKFTEGLDEASIEQVQAQYVGETREKFLFAFVASEVRDWVLALARDRNEAESDKFVMLAALNLVSCISHARAQDSQGDWV